MISWVWPATLAVALAGVPVAGLESALLGVGAVVTGQPTLAVAGLILGVGLGQIRRYRRERAMQDRRDSEWEDALMSLARLVRDGAPLPLALDQLGTSSVSWHQATWLGGRQNEPHGDSRLAGILDALEQHGGRTERVIDMLVQQIRFEQSLRWELDNALAGPRGSMLMLTGAPWLMLAGFRAAFPAFYAGLVGVSLGQATVILVATVEAVVLWLGWRTNGGMSP
jgi:Flp pilus assembly protein TadB